MWQRDRPGICNGSQYSGLEIPLRLHPDVFVSLDDAVELRRTVAPAAHANRYRLVKYLCRPPVSAQRLQAQPDGRYELTLKTLWRDGLFVAAP